jgi:DNA-binding NtrC family response regulator
VTTALKIPDRRPTSLIDQRRIHGIPTATSLRIAYNTSKSPFVMKRILFVDDEMAVLDGIRTMLRKKRNEWHLEFANSAAKALELLEQHRFDLICSDMRMPGMDGAQLLTLVSERWPRVARIVLSGHAELAQTAKMRIVAHESLGKPCNAEQLQSTIDRCLAVETLVAAPTA